MVVTLHGRHPLDAVKEVLGLGETYLGQRDDRYALGHCRHILVILHQYLSDGLILGCSPACLTDGGVVVVAGEVGLQTDVLGIVGARGEAEVGATVHHVEVEADAGIEILLHLLGKGIGADLLERLVPVVEPSGIELCHHVGAHSAMIGVYLLLDGVDIVFAVTCGQCALDGSTLEEPAAVAGEHRYVKAGIDELLSDGGTILSVYIEGDVLALADVRAELVFSLYHDDGTAFGYLEVAHLGCELSDVGAARVKESLVLCAYLHLGHGAEPPGIAAVLPLATGIGTGTQDDHHALVGSSLEEGAYVAVTSGPVPHSGCGLVVVPEDIGSHGVESEGLHHAQTVMPIGCGHARIVHLARVYLYGLAVVDKVASLYLESMLGLGSGCGGEAWQQGHGDHDDDNDK